MHKTITADKFYSYGKRIEVRAGQILYDSEIYRTKKRAYFLDQGICALSQMTHGGDERIYLYFAEKKTIGFAQLLPALTERGFGPASNFRITAKTDCVVYRIEKEQFDRLLEENHDFRTFMLDVLSLNYSEILRRYHQAQDMTIPQRIASLMLEFKKEENGQYYLPSFLSYAEMATYLGTHVVTVSRIMAQMKKLGYFEKEGRRIIIKDEKKLLELIENDELTIKY